jgi:two-component system, OmpR family, sensor histidine kinase CiaH
MSRNPHRRTALLFGVLTVYIILQFAWWAVLLLRKDREIRAMALELQALGTEVVVPGDPQRSLLMVVGEGSVFLILLLAVLYVTFRAIRRDLDLARTQRNFLLAVTHELRTPIAAIKLQLQTLDRPNLDTTQSQALRTRAIEETDRLGQLTEKVLLASSAEEEMLGLSTRQLDAMELMHSVVAHARVTLAPEHKITLEGPEKLTVTSDPQALRSIVDNLIENASKYAPPGSTIALSLEAGLEGWRVSVSDEGPGVPSADQDRIFERFFRSGNEETRKAKGTGLGLYIVKRLAQALGGTVTIRDRQPHGAIFAVSFPTH